MKDYGHGWKNLKRNLNNPIKNKILRIVSPDSLFNLKNLFFDANFTINEHSKYNINNNKFSGCKVCWCDNFSSIF